MANFLAALVFPSLLIYKPLPGDFFHIDQGDVLNLQIAWIGLTNLGPFFIFLGAGVLYARHRLLSTKSKTNCEICTCIITCILMAACVTSIYITTFIRSEYDAQTSLEIIAYISMLILALLSGALTTRFIN